MERGEKSSKYAACGPPISGRLVSRDRNTGAPKYIASSGGNPNPSASEGNKNASQCASNHAFTASSMPNST